MYQGGVPAPLPPWNIIWASSSPLGLLALSRPRCDRKEERKEEENSLGLISPKPQGGEERREERLSWPRQSLRGERREEKSSLGLVSP